LGNGLIVTTAPDRDTTRVEALSDGVFAIAITLLVIELKVPRDIGESLGHALAEQWPSYIAFLASFAVIGIMWLNHHRMFRMIVHATHGILVLNALLLLMISAVPFPTALVSEYIGHEGGRLAAAVYTGWFVATSIVWNTLWRYAAAPSRAPRVLGKPSNDPGVRKVTRTFAVGPIVYLAAFGSAFWSPLLAVVLCGGAAVLFSLTPE
jgi:uncharacterized membrane protein